MTSKATVALTAACAAALLAMARLPAGASDLVDVLPLTDRILMLHFDDGYVVHHKRGRPKTDEKVVVNPLDVKAASDPSSYSIQSIDDPAYRTARTPTRVGRKSKGTDFAWFVDSWIDGRAVNTRPDHAKEHWLTLYLPAPMRAGRTYTVVPRWMSLTGRPWKLRYDAARSRSEAVHVNTQGYVPTAPSKYAYLYHWSGNLGPIDFKAQEGKPFQVLDAKTRARAFTGTVRFRAPRTVQETWNKADSPPDGNYLGADVWECDFSALSKPGTYVVSVEGVGCSWPFRIHADVYRQAFRTVARALYHNRSGIALTRPYTEFTRPAPHNPRLTPGFAGKLRYTRVRWQEWGSEGGNAERLMAASPGALEDTWGWYQDAGDWDSYYAHLRVAQELMLVYEMGPGKFADRELNIPESGNGVPDILDEAAWLPRFCRRLRAELMGKGWGTGGVGLRVAGDAFGTDEKMLPGGTGVAQGSWEDVDRVYMVSGEDPWSTYRYAGAAAHLALCLRLAGVKRDPDGADWAREAREAYAWAQANTRPGDETLEEGSLKNPRSYAAACLFRLTGDKAYEEQLKRDMARVQADTQLWDEPAYGPFAYALGDEASADPDLMRRLRGAVLTTADESLGRVAGIRALRWGGNFWFPMLCGQQTTPVVLEGAVAYAITRKSDPARARRYLGALYTTCDYFLGTNSLNQTWVTGLGPRYPAQIFHLDAWYNGKDTVHPGLIPYSPWRKVKDLGQGPWDADWANPTAYPPIDAWPGNERWFSNRCSPTASEFTVHQNLGPAAAMFGFLCGEAKPTGAARPAARRGAPAPGR